jgi:hypothetical protein
MHAVGLPQIVGQPGLEFAAILEPSLCPFHQAIGSQEPVCRRSGNRGLGKLASRTDQSQTGLGIYRLTFPVI